ncbi:MAG: nitronate monooxygenase [Pseudomonadota bacterium]
MSELTTRFTAAYGCKHPIACAGLAFAGMWPKLPIAVGEAGGLGALGVGALPPPMTAAFVKEIKAATPAPLNVNFITIFADDAHLDAALEAGPDIISFHWGHPPKAWIDRINGAGLKVWEQVGGPDAAKRALDDGVDLIVAQGSEAGGHNYAEAPTFVLTPQIVDAADGALVLAAGGVSDGRGLAAALALGADGVWVGTRFAASEEANTTEDYRARVLAASAGDTTLSSIFGRHIPDFNPMRVLKTPFVASFEGREEEAPADVEAQPVIGESRLGEMRIPLNRFSNALAMADAEGDFDEMPHLVGEGAALIHEVKPVRQIIDEMTAEAASILGRLAPDSRA